MTANSTAGPADINLFEDDSATIFPILSTTTGTVRLMGGTFRNSSLIEGAAVKLTVGVLTGTGTVRGPLEVAGGTVAPGDGPGILNMGAVTFRPGSTFFVELNGTGLVPTPQHDQLRASGPVDLGRATLAGTVGPGVRPGDSFTILQSSGPITGTFAQGRSVILGGRAFVVTYNPSSVVLTRTDAPVAAAGGPYALREGDGLALDASASFDPNGDPLTYSWDVNGDGDFGDATGVRPTLTWAQLQALGIDDGSATFQVRVRVDGDAEHSATSPAVPLSITNIAPTATVAGPSGGVRGQARTLTLGAADPSASDRAAGFTFTIEWGDGSTQTVTQVPESGAVAAHVYTEAGTYTVRVTARDKDGAVGDAAAHSFSIKTMEVQGDTLAVGGTEGADLIRFARAGKDAVRVELNGVSFAPIAGVARILAFGQAGNDSILSEIDLAATLDGGAGDDTIRAGGGGDSLSGGDGNDLIDAGEGDDFVDGGAGDDRVEGGGGNNILLGGTGDDRLGGGKGRDILIGGLGADIIHGNGGDDILIGGTTAYDANRGALIAIMAEWGRTDAVYVTRLGRINTGAGGLNGSIRLDATKVFVDVALDDLFGDDGQDWFFDARDANRKDRIRDKATKEIITVIPWPIPVPVDASHPTSGRPAAGGAGGGPRHGRPRRRAPGPPSTSVGASAASRPASDPQRTGPNSEGVPQKSDRAGDLPSKNESGRRVSILAARALHGRAGHGQEARHPRADHRQAP